MVVFDDQQRSFGGNVVFCRRLGGLVRYGVHVITCAASHGAIVLRPAHHHIATNSDYPRPAQAATRVNGRSKSPRLQLSRTIAPCSGAGRFWNESVAPDRSSRVLAMKNPSPKPADSSLVSS